MLRHQHHYNLKNSDKQVISRIWKRCKSQSLPMKWQDGCKQSQKLIPCCWQTSQTGFDISLFHSSSLICPETRIKYQKCQIDFHCKWSQNADVSLQDTIWNLPVALVTCGQQFDMVSFSLYTQICFKVSKNLKNLQFCPFSCTKSILATSCILIFVLVQDAWKGRSGLYSPWFLSHRHVS